MGSTRPTSKNTFRDETGRKAHLSTCRDVAQASELFAQPPSIEKVDILAAQPEK